MIDFKVVKSKSKPKKTYQKYKNGDSIRPKGRPRVGQLVTKHVLIDQELDEYLRDKQKKGERLNDTIKRLIADFKLNYMNSLKKVEALEVELQRLYLSRSTNYTNEVVNQPLQVIQK